MDNACLPGPNPGVLVHVKGTNHVPAKAAPPYRLVGQLLPSGPWLSTEPGGHRAAPRPGSVPLP